MKKISLLLFILTLSWTAFSQHYIDSLVTIKRRHAVLLVRDAMLLRSCDSVLRLYVKTDSLHALVIKNLEQSVQNLDSRIKAEQQKAWYQREETRRLKEDLRKARKTTLILAIIAVLAAVF